MAALLPQPHTRTQKCLFALNKTTNMFFWKERLALTFGIDSRIQIHHGQVPCIHCCRACGMLRSVSYSTGRGQRSNRTHAGAHREKPKEGGGTKRVTENTEFAHNWLNRAVILSFSLNPSQLSDCRGLPSSVPKKGHAEFSIIYVDVIDCKDIIACEASPGRGVMPGAATKKCGLLVGCRGHFKEPASKLIDSHKL